MQGMLYLLSSTYNARLLLLAVWHESTGYRQGCCQNLLVPISCCSAQLLCPTAVCCDRRVPHPGLQKSQKLLKATDTVVKVYKRNREWRQNMQREWGVSYRFGLNCATQPVLLLGRCLCWELLALAVVQSANEIMPQT